MKIKLTIPVNKTCSKEEQARCIFKWLKSGKITISDLTKYEQRLVLSYYPVLSGQ